jgi:ornithine--oxo-acid transaminase
MHAASTAVAPDLHRSSVNPQWAKLLDLLDMNVQYERSEKLHPAAFGQMLVRRMFRESNVLTQVGGNNFVLLKAAPPLIVTHRQVDLFVDGVAADALGSSGSLWTEALALARGVATI